MRLIVKLGGQSVKLNRIGIMCMLNIAMAPYVVVNCVLVTVGTWYPCEDIIIIVWYHSGVPICMIMRRGTLQLGQSM